MGIILFIVSIIINLILLPTALVWAIVARWYKRGLKSAWKRIDQYFFTLALSLDQFGNSACQELFNSTLIKKSSPNRFGNPDETVSSVLGKNKLTDNLSTTGKGLDWILSKLDDNHTIKSIGG